MMSRHNDTSKTMNETVADVAVNASASITPHDCKLANASKPSVSRANSMPSKATNSGKNRSNNVNSQMQQNEAIFSPEQSDDTDQS